MRWRVEVIGWLNHCFVLFLFSFLFFVLQSAHKNLCTFFALFLFFIFYFLFIAYTSIIFFFCIVRIYVLSLLFLLYSVHINHFFLSYCKNLYSFLCFFYLRRAHQSFFSSISYCKNLCIFFRVRISVLIVLESILICFIGYFYNTKGKNMTYTHTKLLWSKKYWRIRICVLFFIFKHLSLSLSPLFRQCHCRKSIATFFFLLFGQCHCHKPIATVFFPLPFWQCHCHKFIATFFSLYFGNAIATNQLQQFFFPPILAMPLPQIHFTIFFFFWEMICAHNFYNKS